MAQDFPFDHFLKLGNQTPNIPFNNELLNNNKSLASVNETNDELNTINHEVLNHLKTIVPELKFKTYFENSLELKSINNEVALFEVKTTFIKRSTELYKDEIAKALSNVLGNIYNIQIDAKDQGETSSLLSPLREKKEDIKNKSLNDIKFTLELTPTKEDIRSKVDSKYIQHMNPNQREITIDTMRTFANFIVGPSNNMAQASSKAVADKPGREGKYQSLYIYSNSGLGKTHLLHAIANEINEKLPHLNVCLISSKNFMDELLHLMSQNKYNDFVKKYTEKVDVLMIDDIHELKGKVATQDQFFHIFNELHDKGKQLVFTSDKTPKEIDGISERIKTRLQWGLVVDIQPPDLETRIAILRRKMESLDLYINEDVLTLIASKIKTNIRELEGSLVRLKAVSELMNVEIEVDLVKEQLMFGNSDNEKEITIEHVAKATAQYFRLPLADLKSKGRSQDITKARHIAMYLARKVVNAKQQEIGAFFGGRDHSSVIHAVNTISEKVKIDSLLSKDINAIESNL